MESPNLISLLKHTFKKRSKTAATGGGGLFRMFKLLPMLTTGCKMAALLAGSGRHRKPLLPDRATTGTLFGYRKGRLILAIQEDPHCPPIFMIELPILTSQLHKEMSSDVLRIAFEADTKTHRKQILEEFVWAVYCNGRKIGYSIRRKNMTDDEAHVMKLLRGVSMGAGVLPGPPSSSSDKLENADGEMTYIRARFDRVVGSKDCQSFYMINPDGTSGQELSIFFLRVVR
ncbi:protein mizu-kussei 1 [Phtheirospermum japonicum]|uniref:Protein mizu-kussei 1 n=1 Tax=Phtheirospermum japonicum TaxID=374723 RepID=A0A830D1U3_9LAMI|nr:protein mizu-kussei 1 [Phtheirospermum japonicum]